MIIVDTALARRAAAGNPVRVGMVGAGYMARAIALQILTAMPEIRLVAISNRTLLKRNAPTARRGSSRAPRSIPLRIWNAQSRRIAMRSRTIRCCCAERSRSKR